MFLPFVVLHFNVFLVGIDFFMSILLDHLVTNEEQACIVDGKSSTVENVVEIQIRRYQRKERLMVSDKYKVDQIEGISQTRKR